MPVSAPLVAPGSGVTASDDVILEEARARWTRANDHEQSWRALALDDLRFVHGDQWDSNLMARRDRQGRPCLVINKLLQHVLQVVNDIRQNRPALLASPSDDKSDPETAAVVQGLFRHIEYASDGDTAYDTAAWGQVVMGKGYLRLVARHERSDSFDQELRIERILSPFAVYLDPGAQVPDGSDAEWGFVCADLSREAFAAQYRQSATEIGLSTTNDWKGLGHGLPDWVSKDGVRVADYYCRHWRDATLYRIGLPDGSWRDYVHTEKPPEGVEILAERPTKVGTVMHYKMTAHEILERTTWATSPWYVAVPIVRAVGLEMEIDGRRDYVGLVRFAKDPQRQYNAALSAAQEQVALAPKAPFAGYAGQFTDPKWAQANTESYVYLEADPQPAKWHPTWGPAPLPQRQAFEPAIQATMVLVDHATENLKATTSIYDAALGQRSNETSGVAIQRRQQQSQTSNFHFVDNLKKAQRAIGRSALSALPILYDTDRILRIIGEDDTPHTVRVNGPAERDGQPVMKDGQPQRFDLTQGQYDIVLSTGPSFATKRQEGAAVLQEALRAQPDLSWVMGDLFFRASDVPYREEMAERMKKAIALRTPGLVQEEGEETISPQHQGQMQQMEQQIGQLQEMLGEAQQKVEAQEAKIASEERIALWKIQGDLEKARLQAGDLTALASLQAQIDEMGQRLDMVGADEPFPPPPGPAGPPPEGEEPAMQPAGEGY